MGLDLFYLVALDWGGPRREWFELICKALFDTTNQYFTRFSDNNQALVSPSFQLWVDRTGHVGILSGKQQTYQNSMHACLPLLLAGFAPSNFFPNCCWDVPQCCRVKALACWPA